MLAGIEGVAVAAGIDFDFIQSGSGFEGGSARSAGDGALLVSRMDVFFHFLLLSPCDNPPQRELLRYFT